MKMMIFSRLKMGLLTMGALIFLAFSANAKVIVNDFFKHIDPDKAKSVWQDALPILGLPNSDAIYKNRRTIGTKLQDDFLTQFGFSAWIIPKNEYTEQTAIAEDEVLVFESIVSNKMTGAENNIFGISADSISNGLAGMIMVNPATGQTNCVFFDNESIYLFNDSISGRDYNSAKRVADYTPGQLVYLRQEYDRLRNEMRWYINGDLVGVIEDELIGFPGFADYGGMAPDPVTNPGATLSEHTGGLSVKYDDLPGQWFIGPFMGLISMDASADGSNLGLIPVDEIAGATYAYPTNFVVDLATASSDIDLYYRNKTVSNPDGKEFNLTMHKVKISVLKAKHLSKEVPRRCGLICKILKYQASQ